MGDRRLAVDFTKELCEAFGVNTERVRSVVIKAVAGEIVTITVERTADEEQIKAGIQFVQEHIDKFR
jgi:hypothetical protein